MPHCILEYSENTISSSEITELLEVIHDTLASSSLFDEKAIKVRAISHTDYLVNKRKQSFVHLQVAILFGRSEDQKVLLSKALVKNLSNILTHCNTISVEIRDIDKNSYKKKTDLL